MRFSRFLLLMWWLPMAWPVVAAASQPLDSLDDFIRDDEFLSVEISPDGAYLAVLFYQKNKQVLGFLRRRDMKLTGGARAIENGHVIDFTWVNDERVVYQIATDLGYEEQPVSTGELFGVNRDGSKQAYLYGYRAPEKIRRAANHSMVHILPEQKDWILIAEYPWVEGESGLKAGVLPEVSMLNVYTGQRRSLGRIPLPNSLPLADAAGNVRFAAGAGADNTGKYLYRPEAGAEWQEFTLAGFSNVDVEPLALIEDGNAVLLSGPRGDKALRGIYRYERDGGALTEVAASPNVDLDYRFTDPFSNTPLVAEIDDGKVSYAYIGADDHPLVRSHKMLVPAFGGRRVAITSSTHDYREMIVKVDSDIHPAEYYLFDTTTNKASYLLGTRSWMDAKTMRPMQPIVVTARDGLTLHGYLTLPAGEARPFPLLVMPHGGPHQVRDHWGYDNEVQLFARHGYAVLQINFRGSAGYGDAFEIAGYGEWGRKIQDDITDATRWAIAEGYADPDRIGIYGGSFGGYAALMAAAREPELYRCAVGFAGAYDLELLYKKGNIQRGRGGEAYLRRVLGDDLAELQNRSPLHLASDIKVPVLLAHGTADEQVPFAHSEALRDALAAAGHPPEWLPLPREGHGIWDNDHRRTYYRTLLDFLDRTMPEAPTGG